MKQTGTHHLDSDAVSCYFCSTKEQQLGLGAPLGLSLRQNNGNVTRLGD